jgi:hypothetical protein
MKWNECEAAVRKILEDAFEGWGGDQAAFMARVESEIASFINQQWGLEPDPSKLSHVVKDDLE